MKDVLRQVGGFILPQLIYVLMRLLWLSASKKFHYVSPISDEQHVCVCWHSELLMSPQAYRFIHKKHPASAIISGHYDGLLIAGVLKKIRIRALKGSSRRGAQKVLLEAFRSVKLGEEVLITPDGPRGPRHSMSDGAIGLALRSHLPIFVMNFTAKNYWQLGSWDKFVIPKPFTKIDFYIQSISLEGLDLEEARRYLRAKMLEHTIE